MSGKHIKKSLQESKLKGISKAMPPPPFFEIRQRIKLPRHLFSFVQKTSLFQIHDQVYGRKENQRSRPYNKQAVEYKVNNSKLRYTRTKIWKREHILSTCSLPCNHVLHFHPQLHPVHNCHPYLSHPRFHHLIQLCYFCLENPIPLSYWTFHSLPQNRTPRRIF